VGLGTLPGGGYCWDFPNVLTVYSRYDDVNIAEDDLINDVADNTAPDFSV